jgi:hypothetical protein
MPATSTNTIRIETRRYTPTISWSCAAISKLEASTGSLPARAGITSASNFTASGYAKSADNCRAAIGTVFRQMLGRADLRERPDAKPGPPRQAPVEAIAGLSPSAPPYDREIDRRLGPMVRSERRVFVRSGKPIVGVLATQGPEIWLLTGVSRPHGIWQGTPTRSMQRSTASRRVGSGGSIGPGWNRSCRCNAG